MLFILHREQGDDTTVHYVEYIILHLDIRMTLQCIMLFLSQREQGDDTTLHYVVYIAQGTA